MKRLLPLVGTWYRGAATLQYVKTLQYGAVIDLVRDPNNAHDPNAVEVWHDQTMIGFVGANVAREIAQKIDADGCIHAVTGRPSLRGRYFPGAGKTNQIEVDYDA